jgi:hypothetical protein
MHAKFNINKLNDIIDVRMGVPGYKLGPTI